MNRAATAWLIRRFLDPAAEILFVEPDEVRRVQRVQRAIGFDAPGAAHPHQDERGRCSFEQLVDERLPGDPALRRLADIVHGADFPADMDRTRESAGLWAISQGFTDVEADDAAILERRPSCTIPSTRTSEGRTANRWRSPDRGRPQKNARGEPGDGSAARWGDAVALAGPGSLFRSFRRDLRAVVRPRRLAPGSQVKAKPFEASRPEPLS